MRRPGFRSLAGGAAGIAAGVIGGVVLTSVSAAGPMPVADRPALIDATHVPPALTVPGEPVRLRFGLVCAPRDDGLPCDGSGTVYLRQGQTGPFRPYALQRGDESKDGRYYLDVPQEPAAAPDGSFDVLALHGAVRSCRADGSEKWAQQVADRTWAKLARGPTVLQQPSEQWMPVADDGMPLSRGEQKRAGHEAKHLANGHDLLVDRVGEGELRVAEVRGSAELRSWRITSDTPLGEVQ